MNQRSKKMVLVLIKNWQDERLNVNGNSTKWEFTMKKRILFVTCVLFAACQPQAEKKPEARPEKKQEQKNSCCSVDVPKVALKSQVVVKEQPVIAPEFKD